MNVNIPIVAVHCVYLSTPHSALSHCADVCNRPDFSGDVLANISFVNVTTRENHGNGISIWPGNLRRPPNEPIRISIRMINCTSSGDGVSGLNIGHFPPKNPGLIQIDHHLIEGCDGPGLYINGKPQTQARVVWRNGVLRNVSRHSTDVVYVDEASFPLVPLPPIFFGCLDNSTRCGGVTLDNVLVDDLAFGQPRDYLGVGWKGHTKQCYEHGRNCSQFLTGRGVDDLVATSLTVHTTTPCCPGSHPVMVSDGHGGRICHTNHSIQTARLVSARFCCLTAGEAGCPCAAQTGEGVRKCTVPPLPPLRPLPLCRHVSVDDRNGQCDVTDACHASLGPHSSRVQLQVQCNMPAPGPVGIL
eukprot:COSAG01_NODE_2823_length_7006_cov_12.699146_10_plen_358_part_00